MSMLAQWLRPQCLRAPETGGSSMSMSVTVSVRPRWEQGVPSVQTTTTGLAVKVTPSPCPLKSESVGVGHPEAKPTLGWAWASDSDKREEYRGRKLRCGTPRRLPIDRPHTDSNGVVAWESVNPNLKFPTQRYGAVGFLPPSGGGGCQ